MSEVRFEKPTPEVPRTEKTLKEFAEALRHQPGRWALLGRLPQKSNSARQYAYSIRRGLSSLPGRAFGPGYEAEQRMMLGENRIYVRYVGGSGE